MYVVIINQPGYLPDTEPVEFETCRDAWEYIREELEWEEEIAAQSENDLSMFISARSQFDNTDKNKPGSIFVNSFVFSVEVAE